MNSERPGKAKIMIGPAGRPLTIDDLPSPETNRWIALRKAKVVLAVRGGLISIEEVCERYRLSKEELWSWGRRFDRHGVPGLRTTQLQNYLIPDTSRGIPPKTSGVALDL